MEVNNDFTVLRVMHSHRAFGQSGNLTTDIIVACRKFGYDAFVFENAGGHNVKSSPTRNYLFGGTQGGVPTFLEIVLRTSDVIKVKEHIVKLLKEGVDNVAFYQIPIEGYVNNPDRLKP